MGDFHLVNQLLVPETIGGSMVAILTYTLDEPSCIFHLQHEAALTGVEADQLYAALVRLLDREFGHG